MKHVLGEIMTATQQYWILEIARIEADIRAMVAAKDKSVSDEKLTEMVTVANELYKMSSSLPYNNN